MVLSHYNVIMTLFIVNSKMSYQLRQLGQTLVLPGSLVNTALSEATGTEPEPGVPSEAPRAGSDGSLSP